MTKKQSNPIEKAEIRVTNNGPYMVFGNIPLFDMTIQCNNQGTPTKWLKEKKRSTPKSYALCRCGKSNNKPFCDGTHIKIDFDGTETNDNLPFKKMAKVIDGPKLNLKDAEILCASARFCHRGGDIWDQIPKSDDPKMKKTAIENSCDCPSGRLVVVDKENDKDIEPTLEKSIAVIEDPSAKSDPPPLWVRGSIPVYSANGELYERRNRVTLCRCGKSTNKPFCDSSHYPEQDREVKK